MPSKHTHNWYNVMLRKNKQVHKKVRFLWYFAISVFINQHVCIFKKLEIININEGTDRCQIGLATTIYWRSARESCGYLESSKLQTRNNTVQMKSTEFRDIVKICPSSTCIEVLFVSHWAFTHIADAIGVVQTKAYYHCTATWLPEEMWNVILSSHGFSQWL